jgi:hypothetical protein
MTVRGRSGSHSGRSGPARPYRRPRVAGTICGLDSDRYQGRPKKPDIACRFTPGHERGQASNRARHTSVPDRSGSSRRATRLNVDHSPDHNNPRQAALFSDPQEPARPGKPRYATTCSYLQVRGHTPGPGLCPLNRLWPRHGGGPLLVFRPSGQQPLGRACCYRPRYLNIQRLNYLWTIRLNSARIAGNLVT